MAIRLLVQIGLLRLKELEAVDEHLEVHLALVAV
eukprot:CAMPEP_0185194368 /NCGR_PEP_ID=MMETSP1140-20130426/30571_1 /TAXON_ID=298111 /ORGANISM="Pavlova sp., Strain CCMP459" /LENGTH=33 /DNA_ID= /DNA_START= /DNA_END= /DNA_ORIENTATION=